MLEMKRKEEEDRIAKQIAADKKKAAYIEKQKVKLAQYHQQKQFEELEKKKQIEKESAKEVKEAKKKQKELEAKKKAIADYKRKKLEAQDMLANADLFDDESYSASQGAARQFKQQNYAEALDSKDSFAKSLGLSGF